MLKPPYIVFIGNATHMNQLKMATSLLHFSPEKCVGYIKLPNATVSLDIPEVTLKEAHSLGAKSFVLGAVNNGGYIEGEWLPFITEAIESGLDIINGMHQTLDDCLVPNTATLLSDYAHKHSVKLNNIRHTSKNLPIGSGKRRFGKRLLTVGTDCSSGKMFTTLCLKNELNHQGVASHFVATGQCGILINGDGIAIDAVASDFISGAVELLSPESDSLTLIEGQGSLFHPAYAGVSLGLLHGAQPDYLILCHHATRQTLKNFDYPLPGIQECIDLNVQMARLTNPNCKCIGISLNTQDLDDKTAKKMIESLSKTHQLPVTDPHRYGVSDLINALKVDGGI
ncbi:MAG: DUF1611 domain-containing protein [Candidatus Margulisiibacteriota bacterium]|nr:DUF1611 domain-containing protein [Candidatus Margulisiibacteriota bacterium]